jgi:outer membrane protein assembly factor BamA
MLLAIPLSSPASSPDTRVALVDQRAVGSDAAVPGDDELKRRGARIGRIEIAIDDVFESGMHLAAPYRVANGLHISTQQNTVAQQLLFHSGDPYNPRLIAETERLLRGQRYLNEASVETVRYNDDNTVDMRVRVHDVWTLSPGLSFGRKGGENNTRFKFEDTNFLGLGKQISLARTNDVDRSAWRLAYTDPNVLGSWWKLSSAYSSMSDGAEKLFALQRPFYSLDSRWSANLAGSDVTSAVARYSLGHLVERVDMQKQSFDLGGGISAGLQNGWAKRYLAGVRYESNSFMHRTDEPDAALPADRVLAYPWIGLETIEDDYISTRNLDQIGRIEDLYIGRSARIEAGFASSAFGSTRDAFLLRSALQAGADLGESQYLIHTLGFDGRMEGGDLVNARLEANSRYYLRNSTRSVFFASVTGTLSSNLDPEEQLLLGGDNGLRGYPLRYQAGTSSALITLEERFYTNWQPLKLVNVGAAVFADAGRTWGRDEFAAPPAGWLTDVGIGLRLGSARSGLGNVLHIDVAFPLNAGKDIDGVQFLVETRKSF